MLDAHGVISRNNRSLHNDEGILIGDAPEIPPELVAVAGQRSPEYQEADSRRIVGVLFGNTSLDPSRREVPWQMELPSPHPGKLTV